MSAYPESSRLADRSLHRDTIVDFLEWLESQGMVVAELLREDWTEPRYAPVTKPHDRLATNYLGIDMLLVEQERRAMLKRIRGEV